MQPGKSSVRISLRVHGDVDLRGSKLRHHRIKIPNSKIDHPLLVGTPEVFSVVRKRGEDRRTSFLRPRLLAVVTGHKVDSQMLFIPQAQSLRIVRAEEQASDSDDVLHTVLLLTSLDDLLQMLKPRLLVRQRAQLRDLAFGKGEMNSETAHGCKCDVRSAT